MRKLSPELVKYFDKKLATNGMAQDAIDKGDARALFLLAAQSAVGIKESGGNNHGPLVELMQKTVDGSADAEPWCMGFVQTCLAYAEAKTGIQSPIIPSEHCLTVWNTTRQAMRVKELPLPGAIIIWRHGSTTMGHTGIVVGTDGNIMRAVEGNTESGDDGGGKVLRDGGGVYSTIRSIRGSGNMSVVGFLKPF